MVCILFLDSKLPSLLGDLHGPPALILFLVGEMGDLGDEDDPGDAMMTLLHPTKEEKLLLLLLLFKLSSPGTLSIVMVTKGPFALKCAMVRFCLTE